MASLPKDVPPAIALPWRERHASSLRMFRLYAWTFSRNASSLLGLAIVLLFLLPAAVVVPTPVRVGND